MERHITLLGAERIAHAASTIADAADRMQRAANQMSEALDRHRIAVTEELNRHAIVLQEFLERTAAPGDTRIRVLPDRYGGDR